jgi:hypothetical protein
VHLDAGPVELPLTDEPAVGQRVVDRLGVEASIGCTAGTS